MVTHVLQVVPLVLTLTCVVGKYVCLDNATESATQFSRCQESRMLLLISSDGGETQVVVCKPLVDVALALTRIGEWSAEMCQSFNVDDVTDPCPLLYNKDKWDASVLLSIGPITKAESCEKACGAKTPCDSLLQVVNYAKERFAAPPPAPPAAPPPPPAAPPADPKKKPGLQPSVIAGKKDHTSNANIAPPTTPKITSAAKEKPPNKPPKKGEVKEVTATPTTATPTTEVETHTIPTTEGKATTTPTQNSQEGADIDDDLEEHPDQVGDDSEEKQSDSGDVLLSDQVGDDSEEKQSDSGDVLLSDQGDGDTSKTNQNEKDGEVVLQASGNSIKTDLDITAEEEYKGHGSGFFFSLFLVVAVLCVGGYLFWHNRKKVHDYFIDRRRNRRPKDYRPLL